MLRSLVLLVILVLTAVTPGAQTLTDRIDTLVTGVMKTSHIPGAAIAVIEDGAIVVQRAYGVSNLETGTPLATNSIFELASVTKQFTAAAIMMLVEENKVRLDEPISTYIQGTPAAWERITVRHLLTHTSGLDAISLPRIGGAVPLRITTAQMFEYLSQQPLRWPVGETGWYSDAGYFLLGMIIERASGQTYRAFMQDRIFTPLQMRDSSILDKARVLERRVATYSWRDGQHFNWRRDWDYELPSFFGVFSTLQDLAAWDRALRRESIVKRDSLTQMWTPATLANGHRARVLDDAHGFGWHLLNIRGHRAVGHSGASGTYFLRLLDDPISVVVLTNLDSEGARRHHQLLARSIAGIVRPQLQPPHDMTPRDDADADDTRVVQQVIADIDARRPSAAMASGYRAWYDASPGWRAWSRSQIGAATALKFLARDELDGRTLWGSEPLARLVHYVAGVKGRSMYLSVGLTADRKVALLEFHATTP